MKIDESSMDGISRSVRVKVLIEPLKPLKQGAFVELNGASKFWSLLNTRGSHLFAIFVEL